AAALLATLGVTPRVSAQEEKKLKLLFSDKPDETTARPNLLLRPNLVQPIYVFIENTGGTPEDVTVEVSAGGDTVEGSAVKVAAPTGRRRPERSPASPSARRPCRCRARSRYLIPSRPRPRSAC